MHSRNTVLTIVLALAPLAAAAQQTPIVVGFPCTGPQPGLCRLEQANAGQDVLVGVFVGVGIGGTFSISSSDPLAELPGPITVDPSAQGSDFSVVFHTLGNQSITVTDPSGRLGAGTGTIRIVAASAGAAIPDLSDSVRVAFAALLAVAGVWILRGQLA